MGPVSQIVERVKGKSNMIMRKERVICLRSSAYMLYIMVLIIEIPPACQ